MSEKEIKNCFAGIKHVIAVASGKGGVGKSLVAHQLALALNRIPAKVGLVDADIYGPSQPTMLNAQTSKPQIHNKRFQPVKRKNLETMSIGYLTPPDTAVMWRGPMIGKAVEQLLMDTDWSELDYLLVDLPPGTGDVQLTLAQKLPLSGVVLVTTPQEIALIDVTRAANMFVKLGIPLLGVIENMSVLHCEACGHAQNIFGAGGGEKLAKAFNIPFLGQIPLHPELRANADTGEDSLNFHEIFAMLATKMAAQLALHPKRYAQKFPRTKENEG